MHRAEEGLEQIQKEAMSRQDPPHADELTHSSPGSAASLAAAIQLATGIDGRGYISPNITQTESGDSLAAAGTAVGLDSGAIKDIDSGAIKGIRDDLATPEAADNAESSISSATAEPVKLSTSALIRSMRDHNEQYAQDRREIQILHQQQLFPQHFSLGGGGRMRTRRRKKRKKRKKRNKRRRKKRKRKRRKRKKRRRRTVTLRSRRGRRGVALRRGPGLWLSTIRTILIAVTKMG
jgi:hypothetical protein